MTDKPEVELMPPHVTNLNDNMGDVVRLVSIHQAQSGTARGRRRNVEVLNKSAIVLLVACWEAFVEDLATNAFGFLLARAKAATTFPNAVRVQASKALRSDPDETKVWLLAGDGWREVLLEHRATLIERYVGKLNTPKPHLVDELFEKLIGVDRLSSAWRWKGVTAKAAAQRLESLVRLRGEIAHRASARRSVLKRDVRANVDLIDHLAVTSSNAVRAHLFACTGRYPWLTVTFTPTIWS